MLQLSFIDFIDIKLLTMLQHVIHDHNPGSKLS